MVRPAGELQDRGHEKKKTGLQAVLQERIDLFSFVRNDRGHLLIELTPSARAGVPGEILPFIPAPPPEPSPPGSLTQASLAQEVLMGLSQEARQQLTQEWPELAAMEAPTPVVGDGSGGIDPENGQPLGTAMPVGLISGMPGGGLTRPREEQLAVFKASAPAVKKVKTSAGLSVPLDWGRVNCKSQLLPLQNAAGCFMDIVWTRELEAQQEAHWKKECQMCYCLYGAVENIGPLTTGGPRQASLSQIGSDYKVSQLKKDTQFKNAKLIDLLRRFEDVFDFLADPASAGGWVIKLQPGAQAALPGADEFLELELQETLLLPERIEDPRGTREKMQALRIDLLHAIARRGGVVGVQELGQEPRIQQKKQGLAQAKKLIDFIKIFPQNFRTSLTDGGIPLVEILSAEVEDQLMIDQSIVRNHQAFETHMAGKGRGKMGGGGGGGRPAYGSSFSSNSVPVRGFGDPNPYAGLSSLYGQPLGLPGAAPGVGSSLFGYGGLSQDVHNAAAVQSLSSYLYSATPGTASLSSGFSVI